MQLKRGNKADLQFLVTDSNGNTITNLSTATNVVFVLKKNKTDLDINAVVYKNLGSGITIDVPLTGNVVVSLTSADLTIDAQNYFMALQIVFSPTNVQELSIKSTEPKSIVFIDSVSIVENIVHVI